MNSRGFAWAGVLLLGGLLASCADPPMPTQPVVPKGNAPAFTKVVLGKTTLGSESAPSLVGLYLTHVAPEHDADSVWVRLLDAGGGEVGSYVGTLPASNDTSELQLLARRAAETDTVEVILQDAKKNRRMLRLAAESNPRSASPKMRHEEFVGRLEDSVHVKFGVADAEKDASFAWIMGVDSLGEWAFFKRFLIPEVEWEEFDAEIGFRHEGVERAATFHVLVVDRAGNFSAVSPSAEATAASVSRIRLDGGSNTEPLLRLMTQSTGEAEVRVRRGR